MDLPNFLDFQSLEVNCSNVSQNCPVHVTIIIIREKLLNGLSLFIMCNVILKALFFSKKLAFVFNIFVIKITTVQMQLLFFRL